MNPINVYYKIDTIFMNFEKSETSDSHTLLITLPDVTDLKRSHTYIALSNFSNYYIWKDIKKSHTKTINLKYQLQRGMMYLNLNVFYIRYLRLS